MLRATSAWDGLLILNYHRVGTWHNSSLDRNLWSASDRDFDAQIEMLANNFQVIGLDDVESAIHAKRGRYVMVTFDDGYLDNYSNAFPILKRHNVPATFFITTGFIDQPAVPWWDEIAWMVRSSPLTRLEANVWTNTIIVFDEPHREAAINRLLSIYKRLSGSVTSGYVQFLADALRTGRCPVEVASDLWMTWDNIREMRQNGMSFGAHTVTHPVLANLTPEDQDQEIRGSQRRLSEELSEPIDAFSYPVGGLKSFNAATRESLARHGFKRSFTYVGGYCHHGHQDQFAVPRSAVETDMDLSMFRAVVTLPQVFA